MWLDLLAVAERTHTLLDSMCTQLQVDSMCTHLQHIPTHLQHTLTLLLAVNMRTQLQVLLPGHSTITLCLHPHLFQGLQLTLPLSIWTLLLRQMTK